MGSAHAECMSVNFCNRAMNSAAEAGRVIPASILQVGHAHQMRALLAFQTTTLLKEVSPYPCAAYASA